MAWLRRPDQRPQVPVPYAPGSRSGLTAQVTNFATSGLALDATVQSVNSTLGAPQQDLTGANLLTQIKNAGAQPWVPNVHSASAILKNPSSSPVTIHTFLVNSRIWSALVTSGVDTTAGTASTAAYALVKTSGGVVLSIVELIVAGAVAYNSGTAVVQIPGIPILAGDSLILDINAGVGIGGGAMRASCTVLFSTP